MIRGSGTWMAVVILLGCAPLLADSARAQPAHARPGSALFFPVYDSDANHATVITVTNTNSSNVFCNGNTVKGDVCIHYVFFDSELCEEFDRTLCLTPGDTITGLANSLNPEGTKGWLWVEAQDPETGDAIDFDYLTGSAILVSLQGGAQEQDFLWSYTPYSFRALTALDGAVCAGGASSCGHCYTDVDNGNDADFGNDEYESFPSRVYVDTFFEEGTTPDVANTLYLMVPEGLTNPSLKVFVNGFDNNENGFSSTRSIGCWFGDALSALSGAVEFPFLQTSAANELPNPGGAGFIYTGWMVLRVRESQGDTDLGLLGAFFHEIGALSNYAAGHELQYAGSAAVSIQRLVPPPPVGP